MRMRPGIFLCSCFKVWTIVTMSPKLLTGTSSPRIYYWVRTSTWKLQILGSLLQLKAEMEPAISTQSLEPTTTWLPKFIFDSHISAVRWIFSLRLSFFLLWLQAILRSQLLKLLILSTNASRTIGRISSGGPMQKTNRLVQTSCPQNWRTFWTVCGSLSLPTDHRCRRSWLIPGWTRACLRSTLSSVDSPRGKRLSRMCSRTRLRPRSLKSSRGWLIEELNLFKGIWLNRYLAKSSRQNSISRIN